MRCCLIFSLCMLFFATFVSFGEDKAQPVASSPSPTFMANLLKGKLVQPFQQVTGDPVPPAVLFSLFKGELNYQYYLIYFSAHWCGPCRVFTPQLVKFFNDNQLPKKGIQLIFVSLDTTERDMWKYMTETKMPWLAVAFSWKDQIDFINRLAGPGVPDLVLVDASGKVLADSFSGGKYVGAHAVLSFVSSLLSKHL